ncbi:PQQ-binding-like beta-propeller repeat protein [Pelolinea submarina]|nr:PQQ-binding-like beta-propeller repeat protein [Pelolinea submarina]BBB48177.1 eukaryotic-like serine/threonine-protein kinase [Pelolinea submarina]
MMLDNQTGYLAYGTQVYALDVKNGSLLWKYPAEGSSKSQFYAAPEVSDSLVIVGDYTNTLYALDKENGFEKWQFTDAEDRYIASSLLNNGIVYAPNTDSYLYALDDNGNLLWRFKANGPNWSKPLADENHLYLTSMDHFLYVLNLNYSEAELAADKDGGKTLVSEPVWSLDLGTAVVSNPVLEDGILYVGTVDGIVYAVDLEKQSVVWKYTVEDEMASIWGTPVLTSDAVFFGDENGNLYAVDKKDGSALWPSPFETGASLISSGITVDDKAVFAASDGKIFSIDSSKEPKTLTTLDAVIYSPLGFEDGKIVVVPASSEALVKAIDTNGNEVWTYLPTK